MVGIGAQDDFAYARNFVEQTGTSFTMLWSDSFEPWNHFKVRSNSSALVLDSAGRLVDDNPFIFNASTATDLLNKIT